MTSSSEQSTNMGASINTFCFLLIDTRKKNLITYQMFERISRNLQQAYSGTEDINFIFFKCWILSKGGGISQIKSHNFLQDEHLASGIWREWFFPFQLHFISTYSEVYSMKRELLRRSQVSTQLTFGYKYHPEPEPKHNSIQWTHSKLTTIDYYTSACTFMK